MSVKIIINNGKEYLKVSKKSWNIYMKFINNDYNTIFSEENSKKYCGLKNKYSNWCYSCNSTIGTWKNNCIFIISPTNLIKYSDFLNKVEDKDENILIEIDRNDDNKTI
jgi:hypothetical protein